MKHIRLIPTSAVLLIASICFTAIGCATPYIAPTTGPTSDVRFRLLQDENYYATIYIGETKDCDVKGAANAGGIGVLLNESNEHDRVRPNMIGSKGKPDSKIIETAIKADEDISVDYVQYGPNTREGNYNIIRSCLLSVEFTPTANEQYELKYNYNHSTGACHTEISRLTIDASGKINEASVAMRKKPRRCVPIKK
jgi:hypothetical protein